MVFRVHPQTDLDAREMVDAIRGPAGLLDGMRGEPSADREAIVDVIQRVSQLMGENPRIEELDINPFLVREEGGVALDARVRVNCEQRFD